MNLEHHLVQLSIKSNKIIFEGFFLADLAKGLPPIKGHTLANVCAFSKLASLKKPTF